MALVEILKLAADIVGVEDGVFGGLAQAVYVLPIFQPRGRSPPHPAAFPCETGSGNEYKREIVVLKGSDKTASELMPRVHLAVALLKRWLLGTHQGGVSLEHLDAYLDEFSFRFNRRRPRSRGKLFYRLLEQAVAVEPVPYKSLVQCAANPHF